MSKILFLSAVIFHSIVCAIYIPEAIFYGKPSIGIIASLFETNVQESFEYLQSLPAYTYLISLSFFLFSLGFAYFSLKINRTLFKKRYLVLFLVFSVIATLYKPYSNAKKGKGFYFSDTRVSLLGFYFVNYQLINAYQVEKTNLEKLKNISPTWNILSVNPKYQDYILVIGESMRRDYLSLYGYPKNTTPFLDQTKGVVLANYISAAPNTQPSLLRSLYHYQGDNTQYQNNIVTLAKQAGFETYWLSNQGMTGGFDTVAARVGSRADITYFTKQLSDSAININDRKLLPIFSTYLKQISNKPRLFILHLMGSHPEFCQRIDNLPSFELVNKDMACYLESIKQTDSLIKNIIEELNLTHHRYSLIYFSDHGLSHTDKESNDVNLRVGNQYKENYQVPFIKISSDDQDKITISAPRSAFNFIFGFAQWLGIKEMSLDNGYQFFSETPDNIEVFDWHNLINYEQLSSDPALK
ncbi:sulfatase [Actinobacillus porcinus]|uniref:Sulfatase n=1 Tax=Actinobacillus porcinus TaxID=51048 RepID=A0ABY6TMX7_9PAST|nr:phosphoethanolamine transferase [Actinobacillus porcinus]VFY93455.1 sulfatase [Actinobacillus porcinus]VTU08591.1 sulfatase [Actinobacillus porcinus]